jgi:hypothetical protein
MLPGRYLFVFMVTIWGINSVVVQFEKAPPKRGFFISGDIHFLFYYLDRCFIRLMLLRRRLMIIASMLPRLKDVNHFAHFPKL